MSDKYETEFKEIYVANVPYISPEDDTHEDLRLYITKESWESLQDYEIRKRLTIKLSETQIDGSYFNFQTSVVICSALLKKAIFGVTYDHDTEKVLRRVLEELKS